MLSGHLHSPSISQVFRSATVSCLKHLRRLQLLEHGPVSPSSDPAGNTARTMIDPRFHLAAIVESSDDPIISKDLHGTVISWNEAATRVFGYQPDEMVGQSIRRLIPPELQSEEDEILRKLKAGERIDHYETVRLRKNGERFPISVTISPIRDDRGWVIGASKIARDLSERRKSDETRSHLAAIVDSADDAIISKDLNGIIRSWNEGARRMFGYTADEMIGQPVLRLIPGDRHYEEDEILRKLRAGERIDHYETIRKKKDGGNLEVSVTISPIRDGTGQVIAASKIARDISDRKRVEHLLVQSEKLAATGRMAATVAHEINNPLESLVNLIFLARQNIAAEDKAQRYLLIAEEELERVSHIARQTLGFYRDTSSAAEVYLQELIDNVLAVYRSKLLTTGISVATEFDNLEKIIVSKGEMLQVFSNIIANAMDALPQGGSLRISTRKTIGSTEEGLQTVIRDEGVGIRQEHLERIFEPFFTTKGELGTGIGLWVAKQLIEKRGGHISVDSSTEPGSSGTSITIFIPFSDPALRSSSEQL